MAGAVLWGEQGRSLLLSRSPVMACKRTITSDSPRTATIDTGNDYGFSIAYCPLRGAWFGKEWERLSCLSVHSTPLTDAMGEAQARDWLAQFL